MVPLYTWQIRLNDCAQWVWVGLLQGVATRPVPKLLSAIAYPPKFTTAIAPQQAVCIRIQTRVLVSKSCCDWQVLMFTCTTGVGAASVARNAPRDAAPRAARCRACSWQLWLAWHNQLLYAVQWESVMFSCLPPAEAPINYVTDKENTSE